MPVNYEKIGDRIKFYRQRKGMSQEELSQLIATNYQHISNIEVGRRKPSLELLILIANALEVSADDLLVDNLTSSHSTKENVIFDILKDCNPDETKILTRTLLFLKALLAEYGV